MVCTSSDAQMEWLERVDVEAKHVDVVDDYLSEREEILAVQGSNFSYSHGDHVLKMLLGPILQRYDDLDEKKIQRSNTTSSRKAVRSSNTNNDSNSNTKRKKKNNSCIIL
jgi:hypothetical protein